MGPSSNFGTIPPASVVDLGPLQMSNADVATSDLYVVSLASPGTAQPLDLANGVRGGSPYLPFSSRDAHLGFYPTLSPVAAGGYFWALFTSRRQYGNVMTDTTNGNSVPDPVFHTETKKVWVTALTIGGSGDPSHPAFYLPGQEAASGNFRPFATLAPCKANGAACSAGTDCCGGSCAANTCAAPTGCSSVDARCTQTSDCCATDGSVSCIAGYCALVAP